MIWNYKLNCCINAIKSGERLTIHQLKDIGDNENNKDSNDTKLKEENNNSNNVEPCKKDKIK